MFKCRDLARCFDENSLARENGTFVLPRAKRRRLKPKQRPEGWRVGKDSMYFLNGDRYKGDLDDRRGG